MRIFKEVKGFGVVEILVAVVVVAIIGAAAYLFLNKDNKAMTELQNQAKAACRTQIDDDQLCAALATWTDAQGEPHTITMVATSADGSSSTSTIKNSGDDNHSLMSGGDATYETMKVDGVNYMKMDGVWYKQSQDEPTTPVASTPDVDFERLVVEDTEESDASFTYKKLGNEACGDDTCIKYELVSTENGQTSTTLLWINPDNNRVVKMSASDTDGSTWEMTYTYGAVEIVAPTDAKDFSEMFSM